MQIPFTKMHGLGNDFVVIDGRASKIELSAAQIRLIANRRLGVGCDQLIVLESPKNQAADVFMRIYNADGSEVAACGNASRCVGWLLTEEKFGLSRHCEEPEATKQSTLKTGLPRSGCASARNDDTRIIIETLAGLLEAEVKGEQLVAVNMGCARIGWQEIPVREACDTLNMPLELEMLKSPVGVSMGNPHAVFFVPDVAAIPLEKLGAQLEVHPFFPERANISVAEIIDRKSIKLRVWERGAGITQACGTAACAAFVAARRRGLVDVAAEVSLPGGILNISWGGDEKTPADVWMTGAVATSFSGILDNSLLESGV